MGRAAVAIELTVTERRENKAICAAVEADADMNALLSTRNRSARFGCQSADATT